MHRYSTICRRLAAVAAEHLRHGQPDPGDDRDVREVLRGLRRRQAGRVKSLRKQALTIEELGSIVEAARGQALPIAERDAAVLLLGFGGGFRRSEVGALEPGDPAFERDGVIVTLRSSRRIRTAPAGWCRSPAAGMWRQTGAGRMCTAVSRWIT